MGRNRVLVGLSGLALVLMGLINGLMAFISPGTAYGQSTEGGWSEFRRILPYGTSANLAVNPLDGSPTYISPLNGRAVVVGNELTDWDTMSYLKIAELPSTQDTFGIYDEEGNLHVAWASRIENGQGGFNVFYSRVLKGSAQAEPFRDLTTEIIGDDNHYTARPTLAYSALQKKLFLLFQERGSNGNNPLWFSESGDLGISWSKPAEVGALGGYTPAQPTMLVDKQGNPHIFYGSMPQVYTRYRLNDSWTEPVELTRGCCGRPLSLQAALAPNGDIWVGWYDGPIYGARWDSASDQWQLYPNIGPGANKNRYTFTITSRGALVFIWSNEKARTIEYTASLDNGASWTGVQTLAHPVEAGMEAMLGLAAVSTKEKIYFLLCAYQNDPAYTQAVTLYISTIDEAAFPVSNPAPTSPGPEPTSTPENTPKPWTPQPWK
jgi:hypothetical protein